MVFNNDLTKNDRLTQPPGDKTPGGSGTKRMSIGVTVLPTRWLDTIPPRSSNKQLLLWKIPNMSNQLGTSPLL